MSWKTQYRQLENPAEWAVSSFWRTLLSFFLILSHQCKSLEVLLAQRAKAANARCNIEKSSEEATLSLLWVPSRYSIHFIFTTFQRNYTHSQISKFKFARANAKQSKIDGEVQSSFIGRSGRDFDFQKLLRLRKSLEITEKIRRIRMALKRQ